MLLWLNNNNTNKNKSVLFYVQEYLLILFSFLSQESFYYLYSLELQYFPISAQTIIHTI